MFPFPIILVVKDFINNKYNGKQIDLAVALITISGQPSGPGDLRNLQTGALITVVLN